MGGAVLINSSTGKPEWVDAAHIDDAVKSGSHYSKTGRVNVKSDYTDTTYNIKPEAIRTQYETTPESVGVEIKRAYDAAERAKYDTTYDRFLATAEGFASSLSLGLADPLMDDYSTRMRSDVHSGWRSFGEIAGVIAPAIATAGGSAAAQAGIQGGKSLIKSTVKKVLANTPAGIASRAGIKAGEKVAGKMVEGTIRRKLSQAAVEAAVEGAMWNTGQQLSEAIIEDKEFSAEALLGSALEGGLFGGAIGGGFAAAGAGIKAWKNRKAKDVHALFDLDSDVSKGFRQRMASMADEAIQHGNGLAKDGDAIYPGFKTRLGNMEVLAAREAEAGIKKGPWAQRIKEADEAIAQYEKAKEGYRRMLGLKPGHSVEEAEDALKRLMQQGGKNDIIKFARRLDDLHNATAKADEILRIEGKLDNLKHPEDLVGGYELGYVPPSQKADTLSGKAKGGYNYKDYIAQAKAGKAVSQTDEFTGVQGVTSPDGFRVGFDRVPSDTDIWGKPAVLDQNQIVTLNNALDTIVGKANPELKEEILEIVGRGKHGTLKLAKPGVKKIADEVTVQDYAAAINAVADKTSPDLAAKLAAALEKTEPDLAAKLNAAIDGGVQTKVGAIKPGKPGAFPPPVQKEYEGGRAGGMKRPIEGTQPPIDPEQHMPFIAEYQNKANAIKNQILQNAQDYSGKTPRFEPKAFSDDVAEWAEQLKDEHGAKFRAMDGLFVADALGMDIDKIPVLGPVADSFLKMWVFYRMGGMIAGSKVQKVGGKNRLMKEVLAHAVAAKAGVMANKKAGVMAGAGAYQAVKHGVRAGIDGIGAIGQKTGEMTGRIRGAIDKILTPGAKRVIKKAIPPTYIQLSNVHYSVPLDTDPKDEYGRIAAELERSAHDKGALQNYLNEHFEDIRILDAGLADAVVKARMDQFQYLEGLLPKPPISWPMGMKWAPPASEMVDFKQAAAILANPTLVIDKLEAGVLTKRDMEHAAKLHPRIHAKILEETMNKIEDFDKLDTNQKKMVSILTGQPMTPSDDPWLIAYTQEKYMKEKNEEESHNATVAGANSVKAGTATPGQMYGLGPRHN